MLVKKTFPKYRKRQRNRLWKLKHFEDQKMEGVDEMQEEEDDEEEDKKVKKVSKKQLKKQQKQEDKIDIKKGKDYEQFLQDIEEDPELRANINLYKNDDIIAQLNEKIGKMSLDESSQLKKDLEAGKKGDRQVKAGVRKTAIGKAAAHQTEKQRQQSEAIYKANLKGKDECSSEGDWESVEEDAPVIRLEELLGNMKIGEDSDE